MADFDLDWQYRVAEALGNVDAMRQIVEQRDRENAIIAETNRRWHENYQASLSGSSSVAPSATPPSPWSTTTTFTTPKGIRQAQPDIILEPGTDTSGDYIVERFFEELGGTELISLSRHDLIDGISVVYNPIANLSLLRRRYNPNNVIALSFLSDNEFSRAGIDLLSREPGNPYFDDNGNLVIEVGIIRSEENIEAEISLSGTVTRIEL